MSFREPHNSSFWCQALQGVFPIYACSFSSGPLRLASDMAEPRRVGSKLHRLRQDIAYVCVLLP